MGRGPEVLDVCFIATEPINWIAARMVHCPPGEGVGYLCVQVLLMDVSIIPGLIIVPMEGHSLHHTKKKTSPRPQVQVRVSLLSAYAALASSISPIYQDILSISTWIDATDLLL